MKIVLDNIIFSLQKSGGISTLWGELIANFENKDVLYLEYINGENNIVRKDLELDETQIIFNSTKYINIIRYINPKLNRIKEKFIFISSYYRTCSSKNAFNVTIVHDFTYEYFSSGIRKKVHFEQKKSAILNSDIVICISENTKKDLFEFIPNVDKNKIFVIYNGVADCFFKLNDIEINRVNEKFSQLKNKKNILFVGSRIEYKNFGKVVDSFSLMDKDKYHLLIVGSSLNDNEKKLLDQKIGTHSYTVLSNISNDELNIVYNMSYCLIYPSSYEGFGIPPIEAMKAGLPVVALNSSSIPEVVDKAAILLSDLKPKSILVAFKQLEDENFRNYIIQKGHENAKRFSWKKTMISYKNILKQIKQ